MNQIYDRRGVEIRAAVGDYNNALYLWAVIDSLVDGFWILSDFGPDGKFEQRAVGMIARGGPTLALDMRLARSLMDALWTAGLRPGGGKNTEQELTAMRYHLEDMRRLVFKDKPKEKP